MNRNLQIPDDDPRASWLPPPAPVRLVPGPTPLVDLGDGWRLAELHGDPLVLDPEGRYYVPSYEPAPVAAWPHLVRSWLEAYRDPRVTPDQRPERVLLEVAMQALRLWTSGRREVLLTHACGHWQIVCVLPGKTDQHLELWRTWPCPDCSPRFAPLYEDDYPELLGRQRAREIEYRERRRRRYGR